MQVNKRILLIDAYGFLFRAYYANPPLISPKGLAVGAIYGFTSMLIKLLNDFHPEHVVMVFDAGGKNFRHEIYDQYKQNRPEIAEDLRSQLALARIVADAFNFTSIEKENYEADDIIATLAAKISALEEVIIISSDKDLMQLIGNNVKLYDPMKAKYISEDDVVAKFGAGPTKVRDIMAIMGDSSDNIPGILGIGPKGAAQLIQEFGSLENLLANTDKIINQRRRAMVESSKDLASMSFALIGLDYDVQLDIELDQLIWEKPKQETIFAFLDEYGFKSLYKRIENLVNFEKVIENNNDTSKNITKSKEILSKNELSSILENSKKIGFLSLYLLEHKDDSVILFLCNDNNQCYWIKMEEEVKDLFSYNKDREQAWFKPQIMIFLQDRSIKKITYNLKSLYKFFSGDINSCEDLLLMQYSMKAGLEYKNPFKYEKEISNLEEIIILSSEIVANFHEEYHKLFKELVQNEALHLYKDIDLPLCKLLCDIEQRGIKVDAVYLKNLSLEFEREITKYEKEIFEIAGLDFNIASPKQLGHILFEKMQLPLGKLSPKSNSYVTNVEILEKLSEMGHKIADSLLRWRSLTKLKTTYADSLPKYIDPKTARIYTNFLQTSTNTGRLSSQDPNLQNIPIRSVEGNKIRAAFIASSGCKFIAADYSQIELRILSHIGHIKELKEAFLNGEDIHSKVAAQIFQLPIESLTKEHRRKAKAINFGIIYGISPFGLAKQLNISQSEASLYIKTYFEEYPGIKKYMDETKNYAKEHGYVQNLLSRKCFIPTINDKNHVIKQFAERSAINAPIQGSNADIIKIAMINLEKEIKKLGLKSKLLLQIHDELLFEVPEEEVEITIPIIKNIMENAYKLDIPTPVSIKVGDNWMDISLQD